MNNITKKAYVKPDVALVDFSLSSSIAATCTHTTYSHTDPDNNCTYTDAEGWNHFTSGTCADIFHDEAEFCYHVPTEETSIFSS